MIVGQIVKNVYTDHAFLITKINKQYASCKSLGVDLYRSIKHPHFIDFVYEFYIHDLAAISNIEKHKLKLIMAENYIDGVDK